MKKSDKLKGGSAKAPKLPQVQRPADTGQNRALAQQNRKLLGKHYAAKYGKKRGG